MITSHGFVGFIAVVAGFYGGCIWVDASASLELTQTRNEVTQLQKQLSEQNQTLERIKSTSTKREQMVKDFAKNYGATK